MDARNEAREILRQFPSRQPFHRALPSVDYPHAMILNPGPNVCRLPRNRMRNRMLRGAAYAILFEVAIAALIVGLVYLAEALKPVLERML